MDKPSTFTASRISRRNFIKTTGIAGAAALGPWVISRKALASSGEVNILMWSDYLPAEFIKSFKAKTGITVNYTGIGSNEEIINKMKATKGRGFDIISPTSLRALQWKPLELVQPFDIKRIDASHVNPAMLKIGATDWSFDGQHQYWIPHIWGTEGIAWRTDLYAPPGGMPSYGDIWQPAVKGKTMIRPHSGMLGAGLYMETIGLLEPGAVWSAYKGPTKMRPVWEKITDFCIKHKAQIKLFWNDADAQKNGLMNQGVIVGQTWDGPPLALKTQGDPVTYQAPQEGALAWVDGMAQPIGSQNIDQLYAFINFAYTPEAAGKAIPFHGYNSVVLGAEKYAGTQYKKNFTEAYPGDALSKLNPWPPEPQWYADIRTEYRNKFVNA